MPSTVMMFTDVTVRFICSLCYHNIFIHVSVSYLSIFGVFKTGFLCVKAVAVLELTLLNSLASNSPTPTSQVLGLMACATTPVCLFCFVFVDFHIIKKSNEIFFIVTGK